MSCQVNKMIAVLCSSCILIAASCSAEVAETDTEIPESVETAAASEESFETVQATVETEPTLSVQDRTALLEIEAELINDRANSEEYIAQLEDIDQDTADKWRRIIPFWDYVNSDLVINDGMLPDDLPDTDELAIVVLGFQLNPDGSMRQELIGRLSVALSCALQYPNSVIVCTGGGTASANDEITEAGSMAEWLIDNGIDPERILIEDQSMSTAQNAVYTYRLLEREAPQVNLVAIISSDYHIPTGVLLFETEAILMASEPGEERYNVISNAFFDTDNVQFLESYQISGLNELIAFGGNN